MDFQANTGIKVLTKNWLQNWKKIIFSAHASDSLVIFSAGKRICIPSKRTQQSAFLNGILIFGIHSKFDKFYRRISRLHPSSTRMFSIYTYNHPPMNRRPCNRRFDPSKHPQYVQLPRRPSLANQSTITNARARVGDIYKLIHVGQSSW
jgi:hypothetical protein